MGIRLAVNFPLSTEGSVAPPPPPPHEPSASSTIVGATASVAKECHHVLLRQLSRATRPGSHDLPKALVWPVPCSSRKPRRRHDPGCRALSPRRLSPSSLGTRGRVVLWQLPLCDAALRRCRIRRNGRLDSESRLRNQNARPLGATRTRPTV